MITNEQREKLLELIGDAESEEWSEGWHIGRTGLNNSPPEDARKKLRKYIAEEL